METKSNHIMVGIVTLILLGILAAFTVWLSGFNDRTQNEYDIFFKTSVAGLAKGSSVVYAGVPAGQVKEIALWKKDPEFVRVRITVDEDVPVLQGTTATIQGVGFTGVSQIQLEGALKNAPPISDPGPEGAPVIPTKPGALGELLNNAPLLLERLSTLTENLGQLTNEDNQKNIAEMLENSNQLASEMVRQAPQLEAVLSDMRLALRNAASAAEKMGGTAQSAQGLLDKEGAPTLRKLRETMTKAEELMSNLSEITASAKPGLERVSENTLPETEALIREMRATSQALTALSEKINEQGASSLLGEPALPDYQP